MKSYIIKIELEESDPLIWRRVVMPSGATFNRLHDIIQNVTNFQSGYPYEHYHIFEFDLANDNIIVTNDHETYLEHMHYIKNKEMYEQRLRSIPPEMLEFEEQYQKRLKIKVVNPTKLKVDDYLEKYKEMRYVYDLGDNWEFIIRLEHVVEDYHFGFPTLLDGEQNAPPEDVGGIPGFYDFLEGYEYEQHPQHEEIKEWAESVYFREYDPEMINGKLKSLRYKKTDWDKINHKNYKIIEDKYRMGE